MMEAIDGSEVKNSDDALSFSEMLVLNAESVRCHPASPDD